MNISIKYKLITHFESQRKMSKALGISPGRVNHWFTGVAKIPEVWAYRLNELTGIPIEELRP